MMIHQEQKMLFLQKIRTFYLSRYLLWGIVCFGMLLHTSQYLFNRSLWIDEVGVALNILDKSYRELLPLFLSQEPIDYTHTAPTGFLLLEKFLVQIFGDSEYAFRLFPFFSGIVSIVLFVKLVPCFISRSGIPVALIFFVTSGQLIYYSSALKQYSSDVFITLLLYLLAMNIFSKPATFSRTCLLGIVGAVAIWFSHPAVFILSGVGGGIGIFWLLRKEWVKLSKLFLSYFFWVASFAIRYFLFLRYVIERDVLQQFWGDRFMPFPPTSFSGFMWFVNMFFETIGYAVELPMFQPLFLIMARIGNIGASLLGLSPSIGLPLDKILELLFSNGLWVYLYIISTIMMLAGCVVLMKKSVLKFFLLFSPILLNLIASGFHKYPFGNRMILFIIPSFFLFLGEGAVWIKEKTRTKAPIIGIFLIGTLCAYPALHAVNTLFSPRKHEEARPVIRYLKEHKQEGDVVYVYYASQGVFKYYARRLGLDAGNYITGIMSREDWSKYIEDLNQLRGNKRVWLFFSHAYNEEAFFLSYLDTIGKRLDEFKDVRASVYLYDLL